MIEFITAITQDLVVGLIIYISAVVLRKNRELIQSVSGVAKIASKKHLPSIVRFISWLGIISFFIYNIRNLVDREGQVERWEIVFISFWMWLLMFTYYHLILRPIDPNKSRHGSPCQPPCPHDLP